MKTTPTRKVCDEHLLNAKIGGTNFAGLDVTGYNVWKTRSFFLFVDDPELLERWRKEGVKIHEGKNGRCFAAVHLPDNDDICQIRTKFRGEVTAEILDPVSYSLLDICEISRAELAINEYHWSALGRSGVRLYLVNGTFTINKQLNASDVFAFFNKRKRAINNYRKLNKEI